MLGLRVKEMLDGMSGWKTGSYRFEETDMDMSK
jgi:hypothetical protein